MSVRLLVYFFSFIGTPRRLLVPFFENVDPAGKLSGVSVDSDLKCGLGSPFGRLLTS